MTDRDLLAQAEAAAARAYVPYSCAPRGAALECEDGSIFTGCTVECAIQRDSLCAEQGAVAAALCAGHRDFVRLALWAEGAQYALPCGSCLQLLREFDRNIEVLAARTGGYVSYPLTKLLPYPGRK